ncbi:dual rhodanese domain-containing 3-mercaptopyruvate sulfurtransferase SseA [Desulfuromonas soudanensis]|uniref:Dual rhodanese domain-containing 3-mercaptopyruvate sulfurtransferase SseA n=1 Tax=Desulfuromonas soudanensis TaxID=1603606 RepID=A0A0M4DEP1_9BACT|nr:rhodanese-like domain-containing protein [Desulfuromonas soudanensis]ALC14832.1 dual rhodanese domain-containing 3-mercaptopyruvate sulfurtransferase SseA [Desulfuromonas soudanensis]
MIPRQNLRCALLLIGVFGLLAAPVLAAPAKVKIVPLAEVEAMISRNPQDGNYLLFDSRPEVYYSQGHLPWAQSLPWQEMKERIDELPAEKGTKLVFFCGGLKCDLSTRAAHLAVSLGYTNISVFAEGEPGWTRGGKTLWVSASYLKMILNDRDRIALIVDARPTAKYNEGTIPGSLNLPFREWDKLKGLLPGDKATELIFFCGGLESDFSRKAATKAREMGYTDVRVFAEGWPAWEKSSTRAFALVNSRDGGKSSPAEEKVSTGEIRKDELLRLMAEQPEGFLLIDVRSEADFKKAHLPGAINILDDKIGENTDKIRGKNVVFYCKAGSRCASAYYAAEEAGVKTTRFLNRNVDFAADGSYTIR